MKDDHTFSLIQSNMSAFACWIGKIFPDSYDALINQSCFTGGWRQEGLVGVMQRYLVRPPLRLHKVTLAKHQHVGTVITNMFSC